MLLFRTEQFVAILESEKQMGETGLAGANPVFL